MKISMVWSLQVAHNVVDCINLPKKMADQVSIQSWSNGREQGLCVSTYFGGSDNWRKFCIAECRNSDNIVVNYGPSNNFDVTSNQPNEEVYKNSKYFKCGDYKGAAKFIKQEIMDLSFQAAREIEIDKMGRLEDKILNYDKTKNYVQKNVDLLPRP